WNGDGQIDLAATGDDLRIFVGDGRGGFRRAAGYGIHEANAVLAKGDWNRDGKPDLAVIGRATSTVSLFVSRADGGFRAADSYRVGGPATKHPASIAAGDWNGDGRIDLASADNGATGTISILIGSGAGAFMPATLYGAGPFPEGLVAGDWNGDGKLDLAVSNDTSA